MEILFEKELVCGEVLGEGLGLFEYFVVNILELILVFYGRKILLVFKF